MFRRSAKQTRQSRLAGFERLETRRVLDCDGLGTFDLCVAGDSDDSGEFDQKDLIHVLQAGKYMTGQTADWGEGDWNKDSLFDQRDVTTALQRGCYLQGEMAVDWSSWMAEVPAHPGSFGPPIVITSQEQLYGAVSDQKARDAISGATDFSRQALLMFSWTGSGTDRLIGTPSVVAGHTTIEFQFRYGLTDDLRPHQVLLAVSKDAEWHIHVEDSVFHDDVTNHEFVTDASRLLVSGGIAGVSDEYRIDGSLELTRSDDGTASFTQVDATLRGSGLSSLDGKQLDSVLNFSGLVGLQTGSSTVAFSGWDSSGYAVTKLQLFTQDESLTVRGGTIPPCCDFFQYDIDATATSLAAVRR